MASNDTPPEELGFTAAVAELDQIVADLESSPLDGDARTAKVGRAAEQVTRCRGRNDGTRQQVVNTLDPAEG